MPQRAVHVKPTMTKWENRFMLQDMKIPFPKPEFSALAVIIVAFLLVGEVLQAGDLISEAPGMLSLSGTPSGSEDWGFAPFSDQGAWFGFSLPADDRPDLRGGFSGPFLMPEGRWLGPQLVNLELKDADAAGPIPWTGPRHHQVDVFPGSLRRQIEVDGLAVSQWLWFDSSHTAVQLVRITNVGDDDRRLEIGWTGTVFQEITLEKTSTGILARSPQGTVVHVTIDQLVGEADIKGREYRLDYPDPVVVAAGESVSLAVAVSHFLQGDEAIPAFVNPKPSLRKNLARWNGYLKAVDTGLTTDQPEQIVAVKSLMTMVNNWRAPAGRMQHGSLFPSSNVWYFNGFWAWDSWKHAVGILRFDPELAKDQVRAMFAHQNDRGMIPDVVYQDANEDNWRNTKPPLAGWAIQAIHQATGDDDFVKELYPALVAYHRFWYAERDHDQDGLCEYGATDGSVVAARWESGMDNAVRFDQIGMVENSPGAWSMDQESVDLTAYLYREKLALAYLADALDIRAESTLWRAGADSLKHRIRTEMYDEKTGWFYDIGIDSGAFIPVQGPEGWIPLWAGVATEEQAARVRESMMDRKKFNTHVPFPTVAADHPEFSDGYWRGSVWLDQVYFAIVGLRNYGFAKDADELVRRLFRNLEGVAIPGIPLRENYYPLTGAGQNVRHFSWTAAHLLLLTQIPQPQPSGGNN